MEDTILSVVMGEHAQNLYGPYQQLVNLTDPVVTGAKLTAAEQPDGEGSVSGIFLGGAG